MNESDPKPFTWRSAWVLLAILLAPPLATLLTARQTELASGIGLLGSLAAALVAGIWMSTAVSMKPWMHLCIWFVGVPAFGAFCLFLCCMGCSARGNFGVH